MNDVKIFENPQFGQIRTTGTSEEPMFAAVDVCNALGYANGKDAVLSHVDEADRRVFQKSEIATLKNVPNRGLTFINESGLYALIFGSKLESAKEFKRWVTSEVLPSIRKSGGYIATKPDETNEMIMAKALQIANDTMARQKERIAAQEKTITKLSAAAQYATEVLQSESDFTLTQISKDLEFRSIYEFTAWAKGHGIIYKQSGVWMPTANFSTGKYFTTRTYKYIKADGSVGTHIYTVVTEKGREMLHRVRTSDGSLETQEAVMAAV